MPASRFEAILCAGVIVFLADLCAAHGGQYRGPGDVVPPGDGSGSRPQSGPTVAQVAGPKRPGSLDASTRELSVDLTTWTFWWEFNKDPFIRLKSEFASDARDVLRPNDEQILDDILPALKKALDSTEQRDVTSSCMVAMAKIGSNHWDFNLVDVFAPRLRKLDQEIRETAALSLGIAAIAGEAEVELLIGLALDNENGRNATGGAVDIRTRSFATYGLGLLAHRHSKTELKARLFAPMQQLLANKDIPNRNIKVAAIHAISLLNIGNSDPADKALLADALKSLENYYMQGLGAGEQLIQAHCPTAIAKLIGRDHEKSDYYKELFAADLQEKGKVKRSHNAIAESCAMALGLLARPNDPQDPKDEKKNPDAKYSKLLLDTYHDHKDAQTRWFSILGLGQIGGEINRTVLLKEFHRAGKNQEKPWCALALGVYSFFKYDAQKKANRSMEPERLISETLTDALNKDRDPSLLGALAIALGMSQSVDAADTMREMMRTNVAKEEMCGYLCIGLALMGDTRSIEDIRAVLPQAARRQMLLHQAAIALGKLGDKRVAEDLQKLMADVGPNLFTRSAITSAIGFIGDSRTIAPLKRMLFDDRLGDLSRAFAAVALGGIADKEPLPWNSKISANLNYRAATETLTNQSTGILDIL